MSVPRARLLGRRVDHILIDQSIFAWTHRVLGIIGGFSLGFVMLYAGRLRLHMITPYATSRLGRMAALMFGLAALPFVISYFENRNRVDDSVPRMVLFLVLIALVAIGVDALVMYLELAGRSLPQVSLLYAAQATVYVCLGRLFLNDAIYAPPQ
jgi:hypothetical protein